MRKKPGAAGGFTVFLPIADAIMKRVRRREPLYTGMNGQIVERLHVSEAESYVLKPLTNDTQAGLEAYVYAKILPSFPPVYPRLLGMAADGGLLFEDVGVLDHTFCESAVEALLPYMAWWHEQPAELLRDAPLRGPKPPIARMAAELLAKAAESRAALPVDERLARRVTEAASIAQWPSEQVLSHDDLHVGNYAIAPKGGLVVLDWEHVHLNCRYWDLYHAIDLSHPYFPKRIEPDRRDRFLQLYVKLANVGTDAENFIRGYRLFSAVFSLWMLDLIAGDLRGGRGPWPEPNLQEQFAETAAVFEQVAETF